MKKLLVILTVLAFAISSSVVLATNPDQDLKQAAPNVNCCFQDGQCLQTKKDNCALKTGIVVSDCKDCPGVWGKGKKDK